jgi:hypothetical protein
MTQDVFVARARTSPAKGTFAQLESRELSGPGRINARHLSGFGCLLFGGLNVNKPSELIDARDHAYLEMATAKTMAERKQWREKLDQIAREIDAVESSCERISRGTKWLESEIVELKREIDAAEREAAPDELTAIAQESGES